jgi:hypothetical protein
MYDAPNKNSFSSVEGMSFFFCFVEKFGNFLGKLLKNTKIIFFKFLAPW